MNKETERRILRVLNSAYENSPYFNNIINEIISDDEDITIDLFSHLPIFNKQTIREIGWPNFVSGNYLDDNYRLKKERKVRIERTSGTTGDPMPILWNQDDYFSSMMNHWKYRSDRFGITPASKYCTSAKNIPGDSLYYIRDNKLVFDIRDLTYKNIAEIIKVINDFEPDWLYLQNSILYVFIYAADKLGLNFPNSIKYIEYIGEPLCSYYREKIEKMISVPSSSMYGCVETNGMAFECEYGHDHLVSDNTYVEIVDRDGNVKKDGETGYVCTTGLHNTAMPILRYRLNDLASIDRETNCSCGNKNPIIHIKAARMPEFLILDDTAVYDKAQLYSPTNAGMDLFEVCQDDIAFNLKMNTLDDYEILVYQNGHTEIDVDEILREAFRAYGLPNIKFSVKVIEKFDASKRSGILRLR